MRGSTTRWPIDQPMRFLVHDYAGHPFQAQLSRGLARSGHEVEHVSCDAYVSGKGELRLRDGDAQGLRFSTISMGGVDFAKYDLRKRPAQEWHYAKDFMRHLRSAPPDVIVMCNTPLIAHALIARSCRRQHIPMVFWHQDICSQALGVESRRRLHLLGPGMAAGFDWLEGWIARTSEQIVVIAPTFIPVHRRWGTEGRVTLIPNWAPLDELDVRPRINPWAIEHGLDRCPVMLYAGTLGLKHDPQLLIDLAGRLEDLVPGFRLVVVSEGTGASFVRERAGAHAITVLPFQPFHALPDVLATGDVLIVILEPDASEYSVPSKTLSYLCAGRPIVALLPSSNPAFDTVQAGGGLAYDLEKLDIAVVASEVAALLSDEADRRHRGALARALAEEMFDLEEVVESFERVLFRAARCTTTK